MGDGERVIKQQQLRDTKKACSLWGASSAGVVSVAFYREAQVGAAFYLCIFLSSFLIGTVRLDVVP